MNGAVILQGVAQGLTEFLPVSSSGHLFLIGRLFKGGPLSLSLVLILHLATLLSVFVVFRKELISFAGNIKQKTQKILLANILTSLLPLAGAGLFLRPLIQKSFEKHIVGFGFLSTGLLLLSLVFAPKKNLSLEKINFKKALVIGFAQALAVLPGFSRSGWTISAGLYCGLCPRTAVYFSFLISIPAVFGSVTADVLLNFFQNPPPPAAGNSPPIEALTAMFPEGLASTALSFFCAFLSGLFSLWAVLKMSQAEKLPLFSIWLVPLGLAVLLFL